ncbi:MAG: sensor histidine kinase N-terminal domain-containing protein [Rhizobiales bacterium]|nr:sensor histidine kinase N-terminal domain-containing protein [Hyphomicrobiales bacterium]
MTRQLIAWLIAALTGFWLLAAGLGAFVMREEFDEIFDGSLQETAQRLMPLMVDDLAKRIGSPETRRLDEQALENEEEYLVYQVRDQSGAVVLRSRDAPAAPFSAPLVTGFFQDRTYRFYSAANTEGTLFIQVADALANRQEAVTEGATALLIPLAVLIPVSAGLIMIIVRRALRPVADLRQAIERKDGGNMAPIPLTGLPQELASIGRSVNLLLGRLEAAFEAEREFTANSAHELRTPIAGALAQTQLLISLLREDGPRRRAEQIEASLVKLVHLAEKLLQLARADAGIGSSAAMTDLTPVLDVVIDDFERQGASENRILYRRPADLRLVGPYNEDAFAIVVRNLIENALRHGRADTPVEVEASNGAIAIRNHCPALTVDELDTIRQRFGRGKTRATGTGLGLSIVDRMLAHMQARLDLRSPAPGREDGFEARILFDRTA